jgi:PAS domain S-box-containing protein
MHKRTASEHHQLLFETMLQGVVFQDAQGTVVSVNPAAERILGKTVDEFVGQSSRSVGGDTVREDGSPFPIAEHPSMVALNTGREQRNVVMGVFNPRQGRRRWISVSAVPLFQSPEDTSPYEVFTQFDDITETRNVAKALGEREAQLKTIVDNIHEGVVVSDLAGHLLFWNRAALEMHGFSTMEGCLKVLAEFPAIFELSTLDGVVLPVNEWPLARVLRGEQLRDVEVQNRHLHEGWTRIYSYAGALARDGDGRALLAVVTISDITDRKRLVEGLLDAARERATRESESRDLDGPRPVAKPDPLE